MIFLNECFWRGVGAPADVSQLMLGRKNLFCFSCHVDFIFQHYLVQKIVSATWKNEELGIIINYTMLPCNTSSIFIFFSAVWSFWPKNKNWLALFFSKKKPQKTQFENWNSSKWGYKHSTLGQQRSKTPFWSFLDLVWEIFICKTPFVSTKCVYDYNPLLNVNLLIPLL